MSRWKQTSIERFETRVLRQPDGCWEWQGAVRKKSRHGYFWLNGTMEHAHRVAWKLYVGPIPPKSYVLHKCDNPRCVNVDHLYLGTHQDNMRDVKMRGNRHCMGHTGIRKLDWHKVATIRRAECTPENKRILAADLGISVDTVARVWRQDHRSGWPEKERPDDCY